jgi:hypothetical protein
LLTQVYHARQIVSQARSQHGMVMGVDSNNPQAITANPLGFVRDMAREIQELVAARSQVVAPV